MEQRPSNPHPTGQVSLVRALSKLGLATRSEARALIEAGRVTIDGRVVLDPGKGVVPEQARIEIAGRITERFERVVVMLNKPAGVVSTRRDPEGRRTVYDCLGGLEAHVVPVGRLDAASAGLLLFTNDTRLADSLTDPSNGIPRVYLVTVRGRVSGPTLSMLLAGLVDRGERLHAHTATVRKASGRETHLVVELRQGKNREIRRLFAAAGHEVTRLKRVSFGNLELRDLAPGAWRYVTEEELATELGEVSTRSSRS
ncbi:MAG: pseudouridine synthase [Acidobacteriota bacterium]